MLDRKPAEKLKIPSALIFSLKISQPRSQGSLLPALRRVGRREPWERENFFKKKIFFSKIFLSSISFHSETFHFQPRNFSISFESCLISDACFRLHLFLTGFLIFCQRFSRDPALTNFFHNQTFKYIFFRLIGSSTPRSYLLTPATVRIPVYWLISADNLPASHQHQNVEQNLFYMWRLTFEIGAARLWFVTKIEQNLGLLQLIPN